MCLPPCDGLCMEVSALGFNFRAILCRHLRGVKLHSCAESRLCVSKPRIWERFIRLRHVPTDLCHVLSNMTLIAHLGTRGSGKCVPSTRERYMDAHCFPHLGSNDEFVLHLPPSETIPPLVVGAALQRSGLVSLSLLLEELGNRKDLRAPISIHSTCSRWNASTLQRERAASPCHDKRDGHIQDELCVFLDPHLRTLCWGQTFHVGAAFLKTVSRQTGSLGQIHGNSVETSLFK